MGQYIVTTSRYRSQDLHNQYQDKVSVWIVIVRGHFIVLHFSQGYFTAVRYPNLLQLNIIPAIFVNNHETSVFLPEYLISAG